MDVASGALALSPAPKMRGPPPSTGDASPSSSSGTDVPDFDEMAPSGIGGADISMPMNEAPTRSTSFADLPHEILLHVFRFALGSQQDLQACLFVCRRWCACAVQVLWYRPSCHKRSAIFQLIDVMDRPDSSFPYASYIRRLNFSMLAGELDDQLFGRMAACHRLERLTLSGCSELTEPSLAYVLSHMPQLVAIDLSGVTHVTDNTLNVLATTCSRLQGANLTGCYRITSRGVRSIAQHCPMLRRIKLGTCTQVHGDALVDMLEKCPLLLEADLVQCPRMDDASVREVWLRNTQLRELKLANNHTLTDHAFPTSALRDTWTIPRAFLVCENLRMIDLTCCTLLTDETVRAIVEHAPRLRNVSLAKCVRLTDQGVYALSELGRHLQHLHLAHVSNVTDRAIIHLAHQCTRIRYLDLACCTQLTDESVFALASQLPKLRRIGLVRVAQLTDRAIYALVEHYTNLERVHLSYCEHIQVPAIFWLTLRLPRLSHLSLTGVPAFRCVELQSMCRPPPKEFNQHQRQSFCVYSGRGVHELRRFLQHVYADEALARQFGPLHPDRNRVFQAGLARQQAAQAALEATDTVRAAPAAPSSVPTPTTYAWSRSSLTPRTRLHSPS